MIQREKENEQKVTPPSLPHTHLTHPPLPPPPPCMPACHHPLSPSPPSVPTLSPHPYQVRGKDKQLGDLLPSIAPHIVAR